MKGKYAHRSWRGKITVAELRSSQVATYNYNAASFRRKHEQNGILGKGYKRSSQASLGNFCETRVNYFYSRLSPYIRISNFLKQLCHNPCPPFSYLPYAGRPQICPSSPTTVQLPARLPCSRATLDAHVLFIDSWDDL